MCGILVLSGVEQPFHHRLLRGLRRRGPDGIGFWSDRDVNIGHARLAIIGLDERGTQPLESATHVLAYNGEIYNFNAIAQRLRAAGVAVAGSSDAEVLLHAWGHWGPGILRELDGFWAFVVYDKTRRRLTLVRDQFGVKPLYYWRSHGRLCVSSLIGTILGAVGDAPELDFEAMSEYVRYQFTFGDKTFVRQIRKVLPGHLVEIDVDSGQTRTTCYEDIFAAPGAPRESPTPDWIAQTRDLLADCVIDSTISDTSFTTFCSGGLDSSLITRIARPEIAYHCNYSDPECNETFFAQQAVQGTGIRLFVVNAPESFNLVTRLAELVDDFDELSIGSVILPLDDLLAQVQRRYKVILTGTGGDELFAGYARYQLALGECYQDSYRSLYQRMRDIASVPDRFEFTHRKGDPALYRFYLPEVEKTFAAAYEACRSDDELETMLRFDRRHFLEGLLNIDDKLAGRHSLETRPSLLHQRLVRHVLGVSAAGFRRNGDLKPVLRALAAGRLPNAIIHRNDKMGFTTPIGTFVNRASHLIRERIMDSRFRHLYDLRRMNMTAETKFSREVFGLLMLDLWLNRYAVR
jgi:asparagine synthase (glutamine-hydrolysing)